MHKIAELLIKYLGLPLLERVVRLFFMKIDEYLKKRRIIKAQKDKEKAIENAKTPDEIRAAHRNNKL